VVLVVGLDGGGECIKVRASLSHSKELKDFGASEGSWFRMRSSVLAAAGFFDGSEFH
jgi:hypothetical protein